MSTIYKLIETYIGKGSVRYIKNTNWMIAEHLLRVTSGLFIGIWIARHLGPENFGLLSYALAFTSIFGGLAKLGLDSIVIREIVNKPEETNEILRGAFWLKAAGAAIAIALIFFFLSATSNEDKSITLIYILAIGLMAQSFEVIEFYFQSQVLSKTISICKLVQLALSSIIKIALLLTDSNVTSFAIVATVDAIVLAVTYITAYKLHNKKLFINRLNFALAGDLLKHSWPMMFHTAMVMIYMKIDQIMIKEMLGDYAVGQYNVGIRLVESIFFIPIIVVSSLFPAILNAKKVSQELYENRLIKLFSILLLLSLVALIFLQSTSAHIVPLLFGSSYNEAISVLNIYSLSLPFAFMTAASSRWFIAENLQKQFFLRSAIAVIINAALNYILIQLYGITGAAFSTLVTYIYLSILHDALDKRSLSLLKLKFNSIIFWSKLK